MHSFRQCLGLIITNQSFCLVEKQLQLASHAIAALSELCFVYMYVFNCFLIVLYIFSFFLKIILYMVTFGVMKRADSHSAVFWSSTWSKLSKVFVHWQTGISLLIGSNITVSPEQLPSFNVHHVISARTSTEHLWVVVVSRLCFWCDKIK